MDWKERYTIDEVGRKHYQHDFVPFGAGTDFEMGAILGGKAEEEWLTLDKKHLCVQNIYNPFIESPPSSIPSYNFIQYRGKEKKFPFMDLIDAGHLGTNQIICSIKFLDFIQNFKLAPYVTTPVIVHHRNSIITDHYVMVCFWHHGMNLVNWSKTWFKYTNFPETENQELYFQYSSIEDFKENHLTKLNEKFYLFSKIFIKNSYDLFYNYITNSILSSKLISEEIVRMKFTNLSLDSFAYKEIYLF